MKIKHSLCTWFLASLFLALVFTPSFSTAEQANSETVSLEGIAPEQIDSILAKLSDEQMRSLLVAELAKDIDNGKKPRNGKGGLVRQATGMLHILDKEKRLEQETTGFFKSFISVPVDFLQMSKRIGRGSFGNFITTNLLLAVIFATAFLMEFIGRRFTADFSRQFKEKAIPDLDGPMRLIASVMRAIPAFIHILVFAVGSVVLFSLAPGANFDPQRYLFLYLLFIILFFRICCQISTIFCAPRSPALRVLPIDNSAAQALHKAVLLICTYIFSAILTLALFRELNLQPQTLRIFVILVASGLIFLLLAMIFRMRGYVRTKILDKSDENKTRNWVVEQFADFWHIPTLLYFIIIWMITISDQLSGTQRQNSAFLMSLCILPLFVIFNNIGQWVIRVSIKTLRIYNPDAEDPNDKNHDEKLAQAKEKERKISVTASRIMSLSILAALLIWVLSLWGVDIPYATEFTAAILESLITMALGLIVWRFASSYIERKMAESEPEKEEEDGDDEWGAAADRGRSYTLLPMLRKFIATTLLVMVVLVVLSAMGLDIGPLLAGAGVIGLAVGFGAQKLVADVFSGFFYLFDDAFRVGEYIQAGSVSGAVESISLRNVMLRHHRGMLQIVPHSDLGSITNFMRGGIIVKFNLEFPYDADVDKIRKVIKKVGQAMLKDEEFGKDFINPVKSAGVREITASVMVIRVKFKAQPGTHFVIRREAYRRITDALAKQGIHYAHRKVIVEIPEAQQKQLTEEDKRIIEAGAAAEMSQLDDEAKK